MPKKNPCEPNTCALHDGMVREYQAGARQRQNQINKLFDEMNEQRGNVLSALETSTSVQGEVRDRLGMVETNLSRILNVRANGSQGFEAVMRELIDATKGIRLRRHVAASINAWLEGHITITNFLRWLVPKVFIFLLALVVYSYLREHGVEMDVFKFLQFMKP
jgi:hypothetical protein